MSTYLTRETMSLSDSDGSGIPHQCSTLTTINATTVIVVLSIASSLSLPVLNTTRIGNQVAHQLRRAILDRSWQVSLEPGSWRASRSPDPSRYAQSIAG